MVDFILFLKSAQNRNRVFNARFVNDHFLEAALKSRIFFNVFAVFIKRCCTDDMQLAARERRFEHIARVHRAFGFTGADHCVNFINKENDAPFFGDHFFQKRFQALLKFTAIFSTGDQAGHIKA